MDDTIEHMFIVLVLPKKSVLKQYTKCSTQHKKLRMGTYARGVPSNGHIKLTMFTAWTHQAYAV